MEFIQLYSDVDNNIEIDDETDDEQVSVSKDDYTFIDDSEQTNRSDVDFYWGFENVTRKLNELIDYYEDWLDQRDLQSEN